MILQASPFAVGMPPLAPARLGRSYPRSVVRAKGESRGLPFLKFPSWFLFWGVWWQLEIKS